MRIELHNLMKGAVQNLLFVLRYGVEDETEQNTSEILNFGMLTKQMNNETKKQTNLP